ncbi:MAG: hypothetical protein WCD18_03835 [Thermosynechococcaceae cyanobacterium]
MKGQKKFLSLIGLGLVLSSIVYPLTLGTQTALANDRYNFPPGWGNNCDRYWNPNNCRPDPGRGGNAWVPDGTYIPTYPPYQRRIVLRRTDRYPYMLIVERDIRSNQSNRVAIPQGSRIYGNLVPINGGYRFESSYVVFPGGRSEGIWAVSRVVYGGYFDRNNNEALSLSSSALAIISAALGGNVYSPTPYTLGSVFDRYPNYREDLVVIYPDRDLNLRLVRGFNRG